MIHPVEKPKPRKQAPRFGKRRDSDYAKWVREQPCILARWTEWHPLQIPWPKGGGYDMVWHGCIGRVQVCHVKSRGAGGNDRSNCFAACAGAHDEQHRIGIRSFEQRWGVDLQAEAERLDREYTAQRRMDAKEAGT